MKIHPVGAELFHADRRTDITKVIMAFRNIANAPKENETRNSVWAECGGYLYVYFLKQFFVCGYHFALVRQNGIGVLSSALFHHLWIIAD